MLLEQFYMSVWILPSCHCQTASFYSNSVQFHCISEFLKVLLSHSIPHVFAAGGDQCWCVLLLVESVICCYMLMRYFDHNLLLYAYEMLYAGECAGVFCCWWRSVLVCFACVICLWDAVKCGWIIWVARFSRSVDSLPFRLRNGHS
jgi:hypothetical protein